jgi:hypothetical protein
VIGKCYKDWGNNQGAGDFVFFNCTAEGVGAEGWEDGDGDSDDEPWGLDRSNERCGIIGQENSRIHQELDTAIDVVEG